MSGTERGYVKRISIIVVPILIVGLVIALFVLGRRSQAQFSVFQWSVYVCAGFVIVWIIATLLNIILFAPVFWLLGKLHTNNSEKKAQHDDNA